jgi:hypothetical protein
MVFMLFSACQNDELKTEADSFVISEPKPDVYLENDYLVFKDYATMDSIAKILNQTGINALLNQEKDMGFISARSYRYKKNEEILSMDKLEDFDKAVSTLSNEGYFNMETKCMDFPFDDEFLSPVLNKDGVVKVGGVLYCYDRKKCLLF